jgi:hypothetical protein
VMLSATSSCFLLFSFFPFSVSLFFFWFLSMKKKVRKEKGKICSLFMCS